MDNPGLTWDWNMAEDVLLWVKNRAEIALYDLSTQEIRTVYSEDEDISHVAWLNQSEILYQVGPDRDLRHLDLETGESKLVEAGPVKWLRVSPQGSRIFYIADHDIVIMYTFDD